MVSTLEHPLAFFDWYFETGIYLDLESFYNLKKNFLVQDGLVKAEIDKENHIIYYTNVADVDGLPKNYNYSFISQLTHKLDLEILTSFKFIENELLKRLSNENDVNTYIDFLKIKFNTYSNKKAFEDFVVLSSYIERFENHINQFSKRITTTYNSTQIINLEKEIHHDPKVAPFIFTEGQERMLIDAIFGFMNGLNEKRERIMSEEQYVLMIDYIWFLVDREQAPEISVKLSHVNISNDLLSFLFWVLHKELYTTKKLRSYFFDFLKNTFSNFKNKEIASIKTGFGTKKRVTKDLFLPEIVTQEL